MRMRTIYGDGRPGVDRDRDSEYIPFLSFPTFLFQAYSFSYSWSLLYNVQNTMNPVLCVVLLAVVLPCQAGPSASKLRGMLADKEEAGSIWALLVAGSNTWMNYRHQVGAYEFRQIRPVYATTPVRFAVNSTLPVRACIV